MAIRRWWREICVIAKLRRVCIKIAKLRNGSHFNQIRANHTKHEMPKNYAFRFYAVRENARLAFYFDKEEI